MVFSSVLLQQRPRKFCFDLVNFTAKDLFTDAPAKLIFAPGRPIELTEIYSFLVIMQHCHNNRINPVFSDVQWAKSIWLLYR